MNYAGSNIYPRAESSPSVIFGRPYIISLFEHQEFF